MQTKQMFLQCMQLNEGLPKDFTVKDFILEYSDMMQQGMRLLYLDSLSAAGKDSPGGRASSESLEYDMEKLSVAVMTWMMSVCVQHRPVMAQCQVWTV